MDPLHNASNVSIFLDGQVNLFGQSLERRESSQNPSQINTANNSAILALRELVGGTENFDAIVREQMNQEPETMVAGSNQLIKQTLTPYLLSCGFSIDDLEGNEIIKAKIDALCDELSTEKISAFREKMDQGKSFANAMQEVHAQSQKGTEKRIREFAKDLMIAHLPPNKLNQYLSQKELPDYSERAVRLAKIKADKDLKNLQEAFTKKTFLERISTIASALTGEKVETQKKDDLNEEWMKSTKSKKNKKAIKKVTPQQSRGKASSSSKVETSSSPSNDKVLMAKTVEKYKNIVASRTPPEEDWRVTTKWEPTNISTLRANVKGEYDACNDEELLKQRNKHYIRVEKIFSDPKDRQAFTFPTKTGLGLFGILESRGESHYGALYYGIDAQGIVYHRHFCPLTPQEMTVPTLQNPSIEEREKGDAKWKIVRGNAGITAQVNELGEITQTYSEEKGGHRFTAIPLRPEKGLLYSMLGKSAASKKADA